MIRNQTRRGVAGGGTDIWADVNPGTNGNYSKLMRYEDFGANCNLMNEGYQGFYGTLNACNGAIKYESLVTDAPQEKVNALAAEAHFIRAHALFNIVEYWGGKYLSTEPTSTEMKSLPMSKVSEFYDVILSDLEFAMKHLPLKQSNQGHVRRAAAYHLYAKACLTYATYTDDLCRNWNAEPISQAEAQELLRKGKAAADELLNNAEMFNTGLYADAKDIFAEANNKDNKEALFVISRSETDLSLNPRGNYPNRKRKKRCNLYDKSARIQPGYMKHIDKHAEYNRINACKKKKMQHVVQDRIYRIKVIYCIRSRTVKRNAQNSKNKKFVKKTFA